ncbi:hypothetical protein M427DRAFT_28099 [Gonapodya prolifera JEL478]|uniref:Uncharacterized protein n=1 Tax=Gonapodya prolifera (strain JEL478) TaxID=1344416 RepID=A0A139AUD7_GONPJ|nr:hypothetical protein M427DRAFT_28099 [Gonapodya prolifera JEL478]|eukprot:KXS20356.1 hypothetical protein M427DRAFT_28099 [Gonapodya prolifera JEL478]
MGVVGLAQQIGIDVTAPNIFFSATPFGTGNDLSQVMGWGRTVPGADVAGQRLEKLNALVLERLEGWVARFDLWDVRFDVYEGGYIQKPKKYERGLKSDSPEDRTPHHHIAMGNYFTIGLQGNVGSYFERQS